MECKLKNKGCQADYDGSSITLVTASISFSTTEIPDGQIIDVCI